MTMSFPPVCVAPTLGVTLETIGGAYVYMLWPVASISSSSSPPEFWPSMTTNTSRSLPMPSGVWHQISVSEVWMIPMHHVPPTEMLRSRFGSKALPKLSPEAAKYSPPRVLKPLAGAMESTTGRW